MHHLCQWPQCWAPVRTRPHPQSQPWHAATPARPLGSAQSPDDARRELLSSAQTHQRTRTSLPWHRRSAQRSILLIPGGNMPSVIPMCDQKDNMSHMGKSVRSQRTVVPRCATWYERNVAPRCATESTPGQTRQSECLARRSPGVRTYQEPAAPDTDAGRVSVGQPFIRLRLIYRPGVSLRRHQMV